MAPYASQDKPLNSLPPAVGPHPSFIQVAKPYVFEQKLQDCMTAIGVTEAKEDTIRLQGVTWIDNVRKALQLPVRTFNTAVVYYHKFRLVHPDSEYDYRDAAAAALFNACKIEDTLKKSRDILCAAYNLKLPPAEQLSSDDALFETHAKTIVGLERLMLEASGFDFRNRYPQRILMKLLKSTNLDRESVGMTAYRVCLDLYRTFAPLKQTTQTMAMACLELAIRLHEIDLNTVTSENGFDYEKWVTSRSEIMETLVDLLDLYTHHRTHTIIGPDYPLDTFIAIRITLNQEASAHNLPRYTNWTEVAATTTTQRAGDKKASPSSNAKPTNGSTNTPTTKSPHSPTRNGGVGERGKDGTIRFMLDPQRARDEKEVVKEYLRTEEVVEEYEIDAEGPINPSPSDEDDAPYSPPEYMPPTLQANTKFPSPKSSPEFTPHLFPPSSPRSPARRRRRLSDIDYDRTHQKPYRDKSYDSTIRPIHRSAQKSSSVLQSQDTAAETRKRSRQHLKSKRSPKQANPNMMPIRSRDRRDSTSAYMPSPPPPGSVLEAKLEHLASKTSAVTASKEYSTSSKVISSHVRPNADDGGMSVLPRRRSKGGKRKSWTLDIPLNSYNNALSFRSRTATLPVSPKSSPPPHPLQKIINPLKPNTDPPKKKPSSAGLPSHQKQTSTSSTSRKLSLVDHWSPPPSPMRSRSPTAVDRYRTRGAVDDRKSLSPRAGRHQTRRRSRSRSPDVKYRGETPRSLPAHRRSFSGASAEIVDARQKRKEEKGLRR